MRISSARPSCLAASLAVGLLSAACATTPTTSSSAVPAGSHLAGRVVDLGRPEIVNRRDFIYAFDFDDATQRLAFVHHVSTDMELTLTGLSPLSPLFQEKVNPSEFDCEDVVVDGAVVYVPSRQGTLRAFDATSGKRLAEAVVGEPLLRVAVDADHVFAATDEGRVLVFDRGLALLGEGAVHTGEVRGLVVAGDHVYSVGTDGTFVASRLAALDVVGARVPTASLAGGEQVFLAHVAGGKAIATVRDARLQRTVVSRAALKRLQVSAVSTSTAAVVTAEGEQQLPVLMLAALRLRALSLGDVEVAICDSCLPPGAELALGKDVLDRVVVGEDVAGGVLVVTPVAGSAVALVPGAVTLVAGAPVTLPGPANDLDVVGSTALVTFSPTVAERSFAMREAEKKGESPPVSAASGAALIDLSTSTLTKRFVNQHHGFAFSGALSRDGKTVATGGWDNRVVVFDVDSGAVVAERAFGWIVRRVRFSPDGRLLGVGAWTPVNALNEGDSEPALTLYPLVYDAPQLTPDATTAQR